MQQPAQTTLDAQLDQIFKNHMEGLNKKINSFDTTKGGMDMNTKNPMNWNYSNAGEYAKTSLSGSFSKGNLFAMAGALGINHVLRHHAGDKAQNILIRKKKKEEFLNGNTGKDILGIFKGVAVSTVVITAFAVAVENLDK